MVWQSSRAWQEHHKIAKWIFPITLISVLPNVLRSSSVVIGRWQKIHFGLFPTNYITHALEQGWGVGKSETCQRNPKLFSISKHITSVLTLFRKADLKFSWYKNSEFQRSHSKVIFQGLLLSVSLLSFPCMQGASGLCLEEIPPKTIRSYLELTSVLSLQLQIICTFSEYPSLALGFLRH